MIEDRCDICGKSNTRVLKTYQHYWRFCPTCYRQVSNTLKIYVDIKIEDEKNVILNKCEKCGEEARFFLDTINYKWYLCSDCYFKLESDVHDFINKKIGKTK